MGMKNKAALLSLMLMGSMQDEMSNNRTQKLTPKGIEARKERKRLLKIEKQKEINIRKGLTLFVFNDLGEEIEIWALNMKSALKKLSKR